MYHPTETGYSPSLYLFTPLLLMQIYWFEIFTRISFNYSC